MRIPKLVALMALFVAVPFLYTTNFHSKPARRCLFLGLAVLCVFGFSGCSTSSAKPMSVEEAKKVSASFSGSAFVSPPRTITDIEELLKPAAGSYRLSMARRVAEEPLPDPLGGPGSREDSARRIELATAYHRRALAARRIGRFEQAIEDLSRASEFVTPDMRIREPDLARPEWNANFGTTILRNLSETEAAAGHYWRARARVESALSAALRLGLQGAPFESRAKLVELYALTGDLRAVERTLDEIRAAHYQSYTWTWPVPEQRADMAATVARAQATSLELRGRFAEAERFRRAEITAWNAYLSNGWAASRATAATGRLALCLLRQGRLLEAEIEARKALRSAINLDSSFGYETTMVLSILARVLREQGRYPEARAIASTTLEIFERGGASPRSSPPVIAPRLEAAALLAAEGQWAAALDMYALARKQLDDDPLYAKLTQGDSTLGFVLLRAGRIGEAQAVLSGALEQSRRIRGDKHPSTAELRGLRAIELARRGDTSTAPKELAEATAVLLNNAEHVDDESTSQGEQGQRRT